MCRLMAYVGPQILVADIVLWPSRSIIKQSYEARERRNDSSLPFHLGYGEDSWVQGRSGGQRSQAGLARLHPGGRPAVAGAGCCCWP